MRRILENYVQGTTSDGKPYCHQDGTPVPCGHDDGGKANSPAAGTADNKDWVNEPKSEAEAQHQKQTANQFRKRAAEQIGDNVNRTPKERCELIASLVTAGRNGQVPKWAVWESIAAVITNSRLASHKKHVFDLDSDREVGGKLVREDAKYSKRSPGYHDKHDTKAAKSAEAKKHPERVHGLLAFANGHGLYLHVGIDPSSSPTFQTAKGNEGGRRLVEPEELGKQIDGSGRPLPFVQLSGKIKDLDGWEHVTPEDLAEIEGRREATYRGIDMSTAKEHFAKEAKASNERARKILAEDDPEATIRAGYKAAGYSDEQIDAIMSTHPPKKT